ncbi:MAG: DUF763 domain-containing protein [Minisyncoccales bacterium]
MRTGVATIPLDYGKCPPWLFERMKRLSRIIALIIIEEWGTEEFLKRLSDPVWFQSLGCLIGFDWNSSGLTTTSLGALKEGLRGLEKDWGIFVCGGKGKTSRKTPEQIERWAELLNFSKERANSLIKASRLSAKVDSSLLQDGYQLYHHNFIFDQKGNWIVIQQGMKIENKSARRYHWLSFKVKDFTREPHSGIASDQFFSHLNLVSRESEKNKNISLDLATKEPKNFLRDLRLILEKSDRLIRQKRLFHFCQVELKDVEFHWHPVLKEKFDLKRLKETIEKIHFFSPQDFESLLSLPGVGPKTIRALSLVSEVIYGAKASFEDPARYSFNVGGKDGTPYFVKRKIYDQLLEILEKISRKSYFSFSEKKELKGKSLFLRKVFKKP